VQRLRLDFAEKQLKEASKRREVGNISELEYDQARLERDVAAAELKGDQIQIARLKLEFAEKQLGYAKKRYDAGVISAAEYNKAKLDRDIAAAEAGLADHPFKANEQASANPAADLREARARLGELRVSYGENHPEVQAQLARIAELERMSNEEPNAPADLREAKATLAELRVKYTDSHPAVQQQLARIRALESK
jgi:hypothetical protein